MSAIQALVAVLLGYMFGCLQTSYLISKIVMKKDIREIGFSINHLDVHDYLDETDAYSLYPNDNLKLKFTGIELGAVKNKN